MVTVNIEGVLTKVLANLEGGLKLIAAMEVIMYNLIINNVYLTLLN